MIKNVESQVVSKVQESYGDSLTRLLVLLFCMKYPKLRFTTECVAVNQGMDTVTLEKGIERLTCEGILGKATNAGITYYYLNKTQSELMDLTEEFLRDWRFDEIETRAERV